MKVLFALCFFLLSNIALAQSPLPANSILQLPNLFTDQQGHDFTLAQRRGQPQLVAMFYTSCRYMCPLIIDSGLGVDHALSDVERSKLRVLLISLDPQRDTTSALLSVAKKRKLDNQRWTLSRTDDDGVRKITALLGVRYRKLADGEFNHTSALYLLDSDGRILARTERMGAIADPEFLAKVHAALK